MRSINPFVQEGGDTVFKDVLLLALFGFAVIALLLLPHINPRAIAAQEGMPPPGHVIVELRWPDDMDADVDLWVQAPGDVPVGYSNKGGRVFNLLRDDLGTAGDPAEVNYETSYSRGVPAGEYTDNVHLYRSDTRRAQVPVIVIASVRTAADKSVRRIAVKKLVLARQGEEITALRFTLNELGNLVQGSIHDLQRPLREAAG